jgi:hypothetical protein
VATRATQPKHLKLGWQQGQGRLETSVRRRILHASHHGLPTHRFTACMRRKADFVWSVGDSLSLEVNVLPSTECLPVRWISRCICLNRRYTTKLDELRGFITDYRAEPSGLTLAPTVTRSLPTCITVCDRCGTEELAVYP